MTITVGISLAAHSEGQHLVRAGLIENVHIIGPTLRSEYAFRSTYPTPPNQARHAPLNPPVRDQCLAKTVYVSFVIIDGDSYRMKQAEPEEEEPNRQAVASLVVMR